MGEQAGREFAIAQLMASLDLRQSGARTTEDIFTAASHPMPSGRIYGGQVVAQSLLAAQRTLPSDRLLHSMHGYFLRPGDASIGLTLSVERIRDGRSFSARRAQAFQHGVPIWSMIASFQTEDPGVEHAVAMPDGIPAPEDVVPDDAVPGFEISTENLGPHPVELRHVESPILRSPGDPRRPAQHVWMRLCAPLGDDPAVHRAALAYLSDLTIQESVLRAHGLTWKTPGLSVASLDHAIWWHRFARVDDWLLYVQESPNARGGRGLATGRMYTQHGALVATIAQEIMIRVPDVSLFRAT